jgi:hypothetical protein
LNIFPSLFKKFNTSCFQQNRYVFDVIVTSWALLVFCISWNFARDIWTVFEEIKHLRTQFFLSRCRRTACTEFFSWFQYIQTVFKINTIIYRNKLFTDEFHYLKWIIKCNTFDVKTCFQQNRYVFDVIVTSWALLVFCISWNFARDIWTVFEEIKHLRSRAPDNKHQKYDVVYKIKHIKF